MADSVTLGSWSATVQMPTIPVAAAMLPTGKILVWSSNAPLTFEGDIGDTPSDTLMAVYDPATGTVSPILDAGVEADMFCPSISYLPNGEILVAGGSSSDRTSIYNPFIGQYGTWTNAADLNIARGYNASVTLSNGDIFTIGGSWSGDAGGKDGELWTPGGGWQLTGIPGSIITADDLLDDAQGFTQFGDDHNWLFAMPNGRVFDAGPSNQMYFFDPFAGTYTPAGNRGADPYSVNGNAVMYEPGKILKIGGAPAYTNRPESGLTGVDATNSAYLIDISQDYANPAATAMATVTQLAPMNFPRAYSNAVVLPDGEVFIVGGQTQPLQFTDDNAVMTPEMWNPVTMQFTQLAAMPTPRDYHSTALLMPDGRVWVGGGGDDDDIILANHPDFEIFTPPYLYAPDGSLAVRPVITSAPASLTLGNALTVSASGNVTSFDLVRMGTSTHSLDTDQRRVTLSIQSAANGSYTLAVPNDPGITMPGYWMLFAVDAEGVPSVSAIIQIGTAPTTTAVAAASSAAKVPPVVTGTSGADTMNLTGNPQSLVINLAGNNASVAAGLNSPSLSFVGSTDSVILGPAASSVQYALQASSGVETINNFRLGQDVLDIDLLGQPIASLLGFDTTVNGATAIALASSADLVHGVVLLNTGSETAKDLLTAHISFTGGHAIMS
jgi:galactose oxidase